MSAAPYLVAAGGAVGAVLRHELARRLDRDDGALPVGTLAVNVLGSFVLGFVTAVGASDRTLLLVGTGACGAFTTFSSFSFDTVSLWIDRDRPATAALNAGLTLGAALGAVGAGWWLAGLA
jgi:CrcB protein